MPEVAAVASAIRRYLDEHPRAADTASGIQRWWLAPGYGVVRLQTVEAALALLEREGVIRRLEASWAETAWTRAAALPHTGAATATAVAPRR
ncbi:MAG: hypothetical protein C0505_03955 [Leptothrix sp. (in: Bacteria)]|nr:hypothetical protein [Leptothrix sp. (in: b-proteobacteria)]